MVLFAAEGGELKILRETEVLTFLYTFTTRLYYDFRLTR